MESSDSQWHNYHFFVRKSRATVKAHRPTYAHQSVIVENRNQCMYYNTEMLD